MEPAGLYLHVPFCSEVCPYCDFAVVRGRESARAPFVEALEREIALHEGWGWSFDTVYLGGGTPSWLPPEDLARILESVGSRLGVRLGLPYGPEPRDEPGSAPAPGAGTARLYLEANPEDADPARAAAWRRLGVATVSLGVQSFDPEVLAFLGRRHTPAEARAAVETARSAGFATVSLDLIYGLPGQTAEAWRRDLEAAVALAPDHLSCYQLTVHERTTFGRRRDRGELVEAPEESQAELFRLTHRLLADAGWEPYEVSSFARAGEHRSRHNAKYWHHAPYLGLGPSAHSFSGLASAPGVPVPPAERWWNERHPLPYRSRLAAGERPVADRERLGPADLALEAAALALRQPRGLEPAAFRERYGIDVLEPNRDVLERLEAAGLVELASGRIAPTLEGLAVADSLAGALRLEPDGVASEAAAP